MTVSTNGQICYGVVIPEEDVLPWDLDGFDGDIGHWWLHSVLGFQHSFEMFTPQGNWIGGEKWPQDKIDEYYGEQRDFAEQSPKLPVELVNFCSYDYPIYVLAIPETCKSARRGYPERFVPTKLVFTDEQKEDLLEFCKTYEIEFEDGPAWYLSSFWG